MNQAKIYRNETISDHTSISTQQREKRFIRKGSKSPRSNSKSKEKTKQIQRINSQLNVCDKSISKFFVKNVRSTTDGTNIEEFLAKQIGQISPPKRVPTPAKQRKLIHNNQYSQHSLKYTDDQHNKSIQVQNQSTSSLQLTIEKKQKQINCLNAQIQKYKKYINKSNQKLALTVKQLQTTKKQFQCLQCDLIVEKTNNNNLIKQVQVLKEKLYQKEILLEIYQQQQQKQMAEQKEKIKRVKNSIFKARVLQYQKERELMWNKINLLEQNLSKCECNAKNSGIISKPSTFKNQSYSSLLSLYPNNQQFSEMSSQLYNANKQIRRLQINEQGLLRKYYQQLSMVKQKKQAQYGQLKQKYTQLLDKYKKCMKTVTSMKVQNMRSQRSVSLNFNINIKERDQEIEDLNLSFGISEDGDEEVKKYHIGRNCYAAPCAINPEQPTSANRSIVLSEKYNTRRLV